MRMSQPVLLVGSVPGADTEAVMRSCAAGLGELLAALPDGETGRRRAWINFLAAGAYAGAPWLETVNRPLPFEPSAADEWRPPGEDWIPRGYTDHWSFRRRAGAAQELPALGYATCARDSYAVFSALKRDGVLPQPLRFMVALPLAESAVRPFCAEAGDYSVLLAAYEAALAREVEAIVTSVPAHELVIQWDIAFETLAIETHDTLPGVFPWQPEGAAFERYLALIERAARLVPPAVVMGLHLCYGDLGHRHVVEPPDLAVCVRMANAAASSVQRPLDFVHMPVPRARSDDAYFAPLAAWTASATRLYLGLVHHTDGIAGTRQRLTTAQRHARGFGIATECGFGRRPLETIPELMQIHRLAAEALGAI